MRPTVTTLTALCLVIHAIFGCCANHAECCQSAECSVGHGIDEAAVEGAHSCCCHTKSGSQGPNVTPTDPAGQSPAPNKQQCSHDHCQWLVNKDCAASLVLSLEFLAFVSCRLEHLVDPSASIVDRAAAVRTLRASTAPLRLYLDLGVLQV
jgi:hypothetical protein